MKTPKQVEAMYSILKQTSAEDNRKLLFSSEEMNNTVSQLEKFLIKSRILKKPVDREQLFMDVGLIYTNNIK